MPDYTREDFERGERQYWTARLLGDAKREIISSGRIAIGTMSSLENMGIVGVQVLDNGTVQYQQLPTKEDNYDFLLECNAKG